MSVPRAYERDRTEPARKLRQSFSSEEAVAVHRVLIRQEDVIRDEVPREAVAELFRDLTADAESAEKSGVFDAR